MFTVHIKKSRMWIPALGVVIALGFFINCVLAPHLDCTPVDWEDLVAPFGMIIGWGGLRDVLLRKFIYLGPLLNAKSDPAKGILTNKVWIPFIGWCLVFGYANNILLVPFFSAVKVVSWEGLMLTLGTLLTVSGFRDYGIYAQERKHNPKVPKPTEEESEAAKPVDF